MLTDVTEADFASVNSREMVLTELARLSQSAYKEAAYLSEPVRTLHHFACTGGTLISRCLACMPNVRLLSEVEPHSGMIPARGQKFYPTDLIALLRTGSLESNVELESKVFLAGLDEIYQGCTKRGERLVLRDHAHSKYCLGQGVSEMPGLYDVLSTVYGLKSILTVRHPFDSYASLISNGWLHFKPQSPDEYCYRYLQFISDHRYLAVFKYEEFVDDPVNELGKMCNELEVPFNEEFEDLFQAISLSGNSGRTSNGISQRQRREVPRDIRKDFLESANYHLLCNQLGYEIEESAQHP